MTLTEGELIQFIGTQNYYKHWTGFIVYTDGVKFVADKGKAYWLIDAIASWQPEIKNNPDAYFQVWKLKVNEDRTALLTCEIEDSEGKTKTPVKQEIKYTDFPLKEVKLYCVDGVLMLPTEY